MGTNSEASDTSWSPARLRDHECLTLATDLALLKCMQSLSTRIASHSKSLVEDLDSLERDATSAAVQVENCIQNLNLISTKQFMEKRVYDEEDQATKEVIQPIQTTNSKTGDIVPKIKEGIQYGLPAIRSQFAVFQNGIDALNTEKLDESSNYSQRSVPFILGSSEFISSRTVGLKMLFTGPKPSEETNICQKEEPEQTIEDGPAQLPSKLWTHAIPDEQLPSDMDSSASDISTATSRTEEKEVVESDKSLIDVRSASKREENEAAEPSKGFVDVRSELEARLRLPSREEPQTVQANNEMPQVSQKDDSSRSLSINHDTSQRTQSYAPPAFTFEPPPIPKSIGLFEDSTSDSDDESLFERRRTTLPASISSSTKSVSSDNRLEYSSDRAPSLPAEPAISSANNLPSNAKQTAPSIIQTTRSTSSLENNSIRQAGKVIPEKRPNLFFTSDSEDDLFGNGQAFKPQTREHRAKKHDAPVINNQTDSSEKNPSNETSNREIRNSRNSSTEPPPINKTGHINQTAKPTTTSRKKKDLFSDSESDDDLFGVSHKSTSKQNTVLSKAPVYPQLSSNEASLAKNTEDKTISNEKNELENNSSTIKENHTSKVNPKDAISQKSSSLFSEDEEDDLFANIPLPKKQTTNKLFVPNSSQSDKVHVPQANDDTNKSKSLFGADVSSSKIHEVVKPTNVAIEKKSADSTLFKIPPQTKSFFYSDDESDDDLFNTSREPTPGIIKNNVDTTNKANSEGNTLSPEGIPSVSTKKNGAKLAVEVQNSAVTDYITETPSGHISDNGARKGETPEQIHKPPAHSQSIHYREKLASSIPLSRDSNDDLFSNEVDFLSTKDAVPDQKHSQILPPASFAESASRTVPTMTSVPRENLIQRSHLSNLLFDDSDDENLFKPSEKSNQSACKNMQNESDACKLDRTHCNNEASQVSHIRSLEETISEGARHLPNLSTASIQVLCDPPVAASDTDAENDHLNAETPSTAERRGQSPALKTRDIEIGSTREYQTIPILGKADVEAEQPVNRGLSSDGKTKPTLNIPESSDEDDLFSPRQETLKTVTEFKDIEEDKEDLPAKKLSSIGGNEPILTNMVLNERSAELSNSSPPNSFPKATEASNVTAVVVTNHNTNYVKQPTKEKPPALPIMKSCVREREESDDNFKRLIASEQLVDIISDDSIESDLPTILSKPEGLIGETSEVDGNNVAKVVEKPLENARAGRIAALKLTLSQQPNALQFPSPGSLPGSSSDGDATNVIRKPFGGVSLFGPPPVLSSVKKLSPDVAQSSPMSPEKMERPVLPIVGHVEKTKDVTESGTNPDSLLCAGRTRPRLPASRRPPTRDFRRSWFVENDLEKEDRSKINDKLEESVHSGSNDTPKPSSSIVETAKQPPQLPIGTKGKLFDDSDSSEDELFKPTSSAKKIEGKGFKANVSAKTLDQMKSKEETVHKSSQKPLLRRSLPPSFLDDDSDDDLFAGPPKSLSGTRKVLPSKILNPTATEDPLTRMSE